jgi:hypothetical protein
MLSLLRGLRFLALLAGLMPFTSRPGLQPAAQWAASGTMATARFAAGDALLNDGNVLVFAGSAGPGSNGSATATAEIYNTAAGTWSATGTMKAARYLFAWAKLADGRVFACGGMNASFQILNSAEIYDPATGVWTLTAGTMTSARIWHTATLLADGRVLVTGGSSANGANALKTAETFDPATGLFTATGTMASSIGRTDHTATRLADGRVLVIGGDNFVSITALAEIWDPSTGQFTSPGSTSTGRTQQAALLLANGKVLIAGGRNGSWGFTGLSEIFNPADNSFVATGTMTTARCRQGAGVLPSGDVLVVGGLPSAPGSVVATAEVYSVKLGTWHAVASMSTARGWASLTVLDSGRALVAAGAGVLYTAPNSLIATSEVFSSQFPGAVTRAPAAPDSAPAVICGDCTCTGNNYGGGPVTINCGESACGSDGRVYSCSVTGWNGVGTVCSTPSPSCGAP